MVADDPGDDGQQQGPPEDRGRRAIPGDATNRVREQRGLVRLAGRPGSRVRGRRPGRGSSGDDWGVLGGGGQRGEHHGAEEFFGLREPQAEVAAAVAVAHVVVDGATLIGAERLGAQWCESTKIRAGGCAPSHEEDPHSAAQRLATPDEELVGLGGGQPQHGADLAICEAVPQTEVQRLLVLWLQRGRGGPAQPTSFAGESHVLRRRNWGLEAGNAVQGKLRLP